MPWQERLSILVSEAEEKQRRFEHGLPLSVERQGDGHTEHASLQYSTTLATL